MPPNKKTSINETKPTDIMARKTVRASIADSMPQGNSFRTELVPVTTVGNGKRSSARQGWARYRTPVYMMRRARPPTMLPIRSIPMTSSKSIVRLLCAPWQG